MEKEYVAFETNIKSDDKVGELIKSPFIYFQLVHDLLLSKEKEKAAELIAKAEKIDSELLGLKIIQVWIAVLKNEPKHQIILKNQNILKFVDEELKINMA